VHPRYLTYWTPLLLAQTLSRLLSGLLWSLLLLLLLRLVCGLLLLPAMLLVLHR
jgi:hypothetical protein